MLAHTGLSATALARRAGVTASTVTRFLNNQDVKHTLSARTLSALRRAAGNLPAHVEPEPALPRPASSLVALAQAAARERIAECGSRLRATREALGMRSPAELAAEIGVSPQDVDRWETGVHPDLVALAVLQLRRGVPLDWLLLGDDSSLPPLLLHALAQRGLAGLSYRGRLPKGPLSPPDTDRPIGALHEA